MRERAPLILAAPQSISVKWTSISHNLLHPCSQNLSISEGDIRLGMQPRGQKREKPKHPIQFGRRTRVLNYARKKKELRQVMKAMTKHTLVIVRCSWHPMSYSTPAVQEVGSSWKSRLSRARA